MMDSITAYIEAHDNTFSINDALELALTENPCWTNKYGQTAACFAAAIGKKSLANGLMVHFGGGDKKDVYGRSAHRYLASPDAFRSDAAKVDAEFESITLKIGLEEGRIVRPVFPPRKKGTQDTGL